MPQVVCFCSHTSVETSRIEMKMKKEKNKAGKEKIGFVVVVGKPEERKENI